MNRYTRRAIFKSETLIPVILEARKNQCDIILAKDHGLYLVSQKRGSHSVTGDTLAISYAEGFNPHNAEFDEWYPALEDLCGGDDFCENLPCTDDWCDEVLKHHHNVAIIFTKTSLTLATFK